MPVLNIRKTPSPLMIRYEIVWWIVPPQIVWRGKSVETILDAADTECPRHDSRSILNVDDCFDVEGLRE
jgi:hypothetical protein